MLKELISYGSTTAPSSFQLYLIPVYRYILCPSLLLGLTVDETMNLSVLHSAYDLIFTLWK